MKPLICTLLPLAIVGASSTHAAITFYSDFTEDSIGDITGLTVDTPSTTGANSGTITLDTANDQLDLTANGANLWDNRENAPIAWVSAPSVVAGETWYVETQINMNNHTGGAAGYDQAGITFGNDTDGYNPGGPNDTFALLLNDWNNWTVQHAAFSVGGGVNGAIDTSDTNIFLRVEITEGGATDTYNFFFKEDGGDEWTQLTDLAEDREGSFANSRVGLVLKSHNSNPNGNAQFDYLEVGVVPEPSTTALLGLGGLALILRRRK
ncbi:PEP-CTERM sorting domain-containing protein [Oceaniferula flava]|uniref:PEP-CTERM sorting domain-containing protein n=1 Tax=Oceaniferula flava TaxID=2800421 RepID=UPI002868204F|nr:PEP-CTERM sorting domain-containing protein [Oceaniferula flavus]